MKDDGVTPDRIMELGHAFRGSKALLSAVELGVFTVLADGPLDLEALRNRVGVNDRGARDFLDALVALGMLVRHQDGRYTNSPETDFYLDRNKPTYVGGLLETWPGNTVSGPRSAVLCGPESHNATIVPKAISFRSTPKQHYAKCL